MLNFKISNSITLKYIVYINTLKLANKLKHIIYIYYKSHIQKFKFKLNVIKYIFKLFSIEMCV